jgi:hypothetical protein
MEKLSCGEVEAQTRTGCGPWVEKLDGRAAALRGGRRGIGRDLSQRVDRNTARVIVAKCAEVGREVAELAQLGADGGIGAEGVELRGCEVEVEGESPEREAAGHERVEQRAVVDGTGGSWVVGRGHGVWEMYTNRPSLSSIFLAS